MVLAAAGQREQEAGGVRPAGLALRHWYGTSRRRERGAQAWHNQNLDRLAMGPADTVLADAGARRVLRPGPGAAGYAHSREVGYDDALFTAAPA
jgi:hypothetical protein